MSTGKQRGTFLWLVVIGLGVGVFLAFRYYQSGGVRGVDAGTGSQRQPGSPAAAPAEGGNRPPRGGPPGGGNRPQLVDVTTAGWGALHEQVLLVGSLKPKEQVEVMPKLTGRLERVLVDVGDIVQPGQLIAELESLEMDQQVLRAEATLAVAEATLAQRQAELENARAEEKRAAELLEQGLLSLQSQQTTATRARVVESQLSLAQAQIRQAKAELEELKIRQQQTKILAPFAGSVGRRYVHPGAMVNPSTAVVNIVGLSTMVTQVSVPEKGLAKLRVGNLATVSVDALEGRTYQGRVARISPLLDPATRSGSVEVEIANADGQLKAEMFARIQMAMGTSRQVLLVPRDAVVLRGQQTGVNILLADRVEFHPIETGGSTAQGVEVLAGLNEGTTVVTQGTQNLKDGDVVMIRNKNAKAPDPEDQL